MFSDLLLEQTQKIVIVGHRIQVYIVDQQWKDQYILRVKIRDVSEASETSDNLKLVAASSSSMLYEGWVEITFSLSHPAHVIGQKNM